MNFSIDSSLRELFPRIEIGCVLSSVRVTTSGIKLSDEINGVCADLKLYYTPELIRNHPVIEMTRNAYRKMGQDPNRYRPAAESLLRRIASGKGLYFVNNMVDILNLISIKTGFSIGGYDADNIEGDVRIGIGAAGEPYEGIGRGVLNIEHLPVFRDTRGAFGTSTSDSVRTMVTEKTMRFLMVFPVFSELNDELEKSLNLAVQLLEEFGDVLGNEVFTVC